MPQRPSCSWARDPPRCVPSCYRSASIASEAARRPGGRPKTGFRFCPDLTLAAVRGNTDFHFIYPPFVSRNDLLPVPRFVHPRRESA